MKTPLGTMPVVAIVDLVELKKTRRLGDYEVISRLALARLSAAGRSPGKAVLTWALRHAFRIEDAVQILETWPSARGLLESVGCAWLRQLESIWTPGTPLDAEDHARVQLALNAEIGEHQRRDLLYWSGIIDELREMRRAGTLLPEGSAV